MVARRLSLGPLAVSMHVGANGVGVGLDVTGRGIGRLHGWAVGRLRQRRDRAPAAALAPRAAESREAEALKARIAGVDWYHSIELGHGVVTPGQFDHRPHLARYGLPARLDGQRVLDVGSFDGFWTFEFERRGAAEVMALDVATAGDLDFPPPVRAGMSAEVLAGRMGEGFGLAKEILGSRAERRIGTVYGLSPDDFGLFDTSHIGNVLVHLRDPALALQNLCRVTRGACIVSETIDTSLEGDARGPLMAYRGGRQDCNWWRFNSAALLQMTLDAGFRTAEVVARFTLPHRGSARDMHQVVIIGRNG